MGPLPTRSQKGLKNPMQPQKEHHYGKTWVKETYGPNPKWVLRTVYLGYW
jgi:hypothetical protein